MQVITKQQVIDRANVIFKNKVKAKYGEQYPDMDMNQVEIQPSEDLMAILEALTELINEQQN